MVLYTDGLIERRGESIDIGMDRLGALASGVDVTSSLDDVIERFTSALLGHGENSDDVCVVAVRLSGSTRT